MSRPGHRDGLSPMTPYQPFLLPCLDLPWDASTAPACPLDEEALLQHLTAPVPWERLQVAAHKAYGLNLHLQPLEGRPEGPFTSPHGGRYLIVSLPGGDRHYHLEHPSGLPLYDARAKPGDSVSLLRPGAFSSGSPVTDADISSRESSNGPGPPLTAYIDHLPARNPSDWHLEAGRESFRSRIRVHGKLIPAGTVPRGYGEWLIAAVKVACRLPEKAAGEPCEGQFQHPSRPELSLRTSIVPSLHGESMVVRFLDKKTLQQDLEKDLPGFEQRILAESEGLTLLVGPTGSGKSTTLQRFLFREAEKGAKILSVEDPVERVIPGMHQLEVAKPPGLTIAGALKAFLRQSPDFIFIGEIRDRETAALVLQAARSGHRILSTLHARDHRGVSRRFADFGFAATELERVNPLVVHQRLVPRLCPACRLWRAFPQGDLHPQPGRAAVPRGCPACHHGYSGRLLLASISRLSEAGMPGSDYRETALRFLADGEASLESVLPYLHPGEREAFRRCQL